jgi:hypothetical protein
MREVAPIINSHWYVVIDMLYTVLMSGGLQKKEVAHTPHNLGDF